MASRSQHFTQNIPIDLIVFDHQDFHRFDMFNIDVRRCCVPAPIQTAFGDGNAHPKQASDVFCAFYANGSAQGLDQSAHNPKPQSHALDRTGICGIDGFKVIENTVNVFVVDTNPSVKHAKFQHKVFAGFVDLFDFNGNAAVAGKFIPIVDKVVQDLPQLVAVCDNRSCFSIDVFERDFVAILLRLFAQFIHDLMQQSIDVHDLFGDG